MKARIKAQFVFDVHVNGAYNRAYSTVNSVSATFKQAAQMAKGIARKVAKSENAEHVQVFMHANCLAVGDVTLFRGEYEINDYGNNPESRTPETTESDVTTDDTPTETETKEETSTTEFEPMTESEIAEIWNESFDAEIPPTHRVNVVCKGFESSAPAWGERMAESVAYYSRLKYPDGVVTIEVATIATTERTHESPPPTTAETPPTKETPLKRAEIRQFSQIRQKWINSTPLTVATPYGNLKRVYLSHFATAPPLPRKYHRQRWRAATASGDSDCARTLSCASHHPNHFASANSPPNYFCNSKIK